MRRLTAITLISLASIVLIAGCKKKSEGSNANTEKWTSSQVAADDSVEGELKAQGKKWTKAEGQITVGSYVQDTLEGRLNQPKGRGAIGRVTALSSGKDGPQEALVDFGRGYRVPMKLSELSLVNIE